MNTYALAFSENDTPVVVIPLRETRTLKSLLFMWEWYLYGTNERLPFHKKTRLSLDKIFIVLTWKNWGVLEERLRKFGRCTFQKKRMDGQRTGQQELFFYTSNRCKSKTGCWWGSNFILFSIIRKNIQRVKKFFCWYPSDELHLVKCNFIIYPSDHIFKNYSIPSFIA